MLTWKAASVAALTAIGAFACGIPTSQPATAATLIYARGNDALRLDPAMGTSSEDYKTGDWMCEGLVRFKGATTDVEPALATSWEKSEDGLTWTFHLRENVKFHDGSPFTADAVVYSFERQFNKSNPYYSPRFVRWAGKFGDMTKVEKVDDHTVKLHFTAAQPALFYNLAIYVGYIVSPNGVKNDPEGYADHPICTGPFKLTRWEKNNFIELDRFDGYWGPKPKLDKVVMRVIPENDVRLLALQKGEVQLIDDLPFNRIADVAKGPDTAVQTVPAVGFSSLNLNMDSDKLKDIRVRQAIEHAINRNRVFNVSFFKQGEPGNQPMPSGFLGHAKDITVYDYDPEKAKKLLAEAGYAKGLKLDFLAFANPRPYFPSPTDGIAMIKADLAKVGIDAEVSMATWSDWIERRRAGKFDITISGWTASTVDPDGVIYPYYHSNSVGLDNVSRFKNADVDRLLIEARSTYDADKRQELYAQAVKIITEQAPTVFFAHPVYTLGMRREVEGAARNPANQVLLNDVSIKE